MGIKLVFVIFAILMSMKSYLANPIVMKTFSLLSNALQPRSEARIGTGVYLRDSFRKQVLIPTFQRIKENIKEIIQVNSEQFTANSYQYLLCCILYDSYIHVGSDDINEIGN